MEKQLLSLRDFCAVTGVGETTAKRLIREHAIVSVKLNRRRMIPAQAVKEFIDRLVSESEGHSAA